MARGGSVAAEDGRLSERLAATLEPRLLDALDHPIRRELLRTLNRCGTRSIGEIGSELAGFRAGQLGYHLRVLHRLGTVASEPAGGSVADGRARYASEVTNDSQVRAVLRATEQWDRGRREAAAAADASPLLTMFRVPRPVRTIRLRSRRQIESERDR